MAKLRNVSDDVLTIPLLNGVIVAPDEVVDVPDKYLEEYSWPETVWAVVSTSNTSKVTTSTKGKE